MLIARRTQRAAVAAVLLAISLMAWMLAPVESGAASKSLSKSAKASSKVGARAKHQLNAKRASVTLGALRRSQLARDRLRSKRVNAAAKVKASKVSSKKASEALAVLNSNVQLTGVALEKARRSASRAATDATDARAKERALTKQLGGLQLQQRDASLAAFAGNFGDDAETFLSSESASEAGRRSELTSIARRGSADVIDELIAVRQDLAVQRSIADKAERRAAAYKSSVADRLTNFKSARTLQAQLAADAEARLEDQLAEAQSLSALDSQLAGEIARQNAALAKQLQSAGIGGRGASGYPGGSLPQVGRVITSGGGDLHGIVVAASIRGRLAALLASAQASGINFSGGGYRSSAAQVALRAAHCGGSSFAIYQMRSSQCRPPTARPGASMHEQGLAIDFTQNGRALTRGSSGYSWLRANAGRFGLHNLPSEAWHWSVNGR